MPEPTLSQRLLRKENVDDVSAVQTLAFLVVECGVSVDLKDIEERPLTDPFVQALMEAWRVKQDRESDRWGTLTAAVLNCLGGNKVKANEVFRYLSDSRNRQLEATHEADLKAMFAAHNAHISK